MSLRSAAPSSGSRACQHLSPDRVQSGHRTFIMSHELLPAIRAPHSENLVSTIPHAVLRPGHRPGKVPIRLRGVQLPSGDTFFACDAGNVEKREGVDVWVHVGVKTIRLRSWPPKAEYNVSRFVPSDLYSPGASPHSSVPLPSSRPR